MIGRAAPWDWSRGLPWALLATLSMLGWVSRARAAEPEPPSKDFLEYLGTIEAEGDDWTIFDASRVDASRAPTESHDPPSPPKKEPAPPPPSGDEP